MTIIGLEYLLTEYQSPGCFVKFIVNETGIFFFPERNQHNSMKADGISYEDNYKGNAMAGIVKNNSVEIRFHKDFSVHRVKAILSQIKADNELSPIFNQPVSYKGEHLHFD